MDFGDPRNRTQRFGLQPLFITDQANDGAKSSATEVRGKAERFDTLDNVLDLRFGCVAF